jgi:transcription elongation factor GreB
MDSPLAKALLGKRLGDDIVFKTPEGSRELYICKVQYTEPIDTKTDIKG